MINDEGKYSELFVEHKIKNLSREYFFNIKIAKYVWMSYCKGFSKTVEKNTKSIQFSQALPSSRLCINLISTKQTISVKTYCRSQFEGDQDVQFG